MFLHLGMVAMHVSPQSRVDDTTTVSISVVNLRKSSSGRLLAFADVVIFWDGVEIQLHGLQIRISHSPETKQPVADVLPPQYRDADGKWHDTVTLPEELRKPLGDCVIMAAVDAGLFTVPWYKAGDRAALVAEEKGAA